MKDKKHKRDLFIKNPFGPSVARLKQDGTVEVGQLLERKEGEHIKGELIYLRETSQSPLVYEGETVFDPAEHGLGGSPTDSAGPAMVNSESFRSGWDRVFGSDKSLPN